MSDGIRLPLRIKRGGESFVIEDAEGQLIACFYFDDGTDPVRRSVRKRITEAEALACVKEAARALKAMMEAGAQASGV